MPDQEDPSLGELLAQFIAGDGQPIDAAALAVIEAELELVDLEKGALLFAAGAPGDALYFLQRGMLEVTAPDGMRLDVLPPGSLVGETALLTGQPRSSTVSALVASRVARLSRPAFERLALKTPQLVESLTQVILPRVQRTQLAAALACLFGPLDVQAVHAIQRNASWMHLPAGEVLMRKGDPGDALYILINGRLRMTDGPEPSAGRVIGDVQRGETAGEFALLTGEPRSATVFAVRDSDLVCLSADYMEQLFASFPGMVLQMTRAIVRRSQAQMSHPRAARAPASVLVLVPASRDLDLSGFVAQLAAELSTDGPAVHLNPRAFAEQFGRRESSLLPALIDSWQSGLEENHRYLIYEADPDLTEWTQLCLRQADRLVLVAAAQDEANPALAEEDFVQAARRSALDLVLIQPADAQQPIQTASWLQRCNPGALHHVRLGRQADFARLARRLTGRAVGLVLSGGGARGFAHLGVLRAIEESGLPVDLIGGTSMGALIGAAYALDWSYERMLDMARTVASPRKLLDYTLPYTSLTASHKVSRVLLEMFAESRIEDLWRTYFCISTNLNRAEPVVHQAGALWEAVRASIAIPGVFTPLLREGELLVDGGVMNNFPIDVMRERFEAGFIVGVNASPKRDKLRDYQFGPGVSGWRLLWSKVNPLAPKVRAPSILSSLFRSAEVSSIYRNTFVQNQADVLILPQVAQYGSLEFGEYGRIIEQGYQDASAQIGELRQAWQG